MKILTLSALVLTVAPAISQTPPPLASETDLKAAYCMAVYNNQQAVLGELIGPNTHRALADTSTKALQQAQSDDRRVRLYLVPRMEYLDPAALLSAKKSGEEDWVRAFAATSTCATSCPESAEAARIKSCIGARFLPF
ncbi:hypothetical protein [Polaromonas sp. YR568]|uniref:hypothetical protein n=1 Tax=Polaromonas sp. YR568 TaxID=1855301 RepID=UPI003137B294